MFERMMMRMAYVLVIASPSIAMTAAGADETDLTIDRLYDTEDFAIEGDVRVRWRKDGSGYTTIEPSDEDGHDIVLHDAATGDATVLVSAEQLTPPDRDRPLRVADFAWSDDGRQLMVFTNTRRVWRANTRGDYWVLDLDTGRLSPLGGELERSWFQFAKFSPDGEWAAYVHTNDIYVEEVRSGQITRLTTDGSGTVSNGAFDWVYEEEWGLRDGFRWSPDGKRIAFWQIDASEVGEFVIVDYTADLYPILNRFPYPKVGTINPRCRVGVVPASGGDVTWMKVPGDEHDDYVARMEWADGTAELVLQRINRRQNVNQVLLADAMTGAVREVFRDEDEAWVEVCDDLIWLNDGADFTFVSERDGWSHVYVVSRSDGAVRRVTDGDYDVIEIVKIDEDGGFLYFIASLDDPTRRFLYRLPMAGGAAPERLTPADERGTHGYQISAGADFAIHTRSSFGDPPRVSLITLPEHRVVRELVTNDRVRAALVALDRGPADFFRVPIGDDLEVDGYVIKPPGFDPALEYPLLVYVYGEPAGQTVRDQWGGTYYLWHLILSQMGYVVVSLDNRGTPSPRGRAWRKSVYGQIGILASEDQAAAVRALLERWTFLDRDRVGVWGWSGGGSMTLNALFRHPDLYHAGIAIAFVANQRYYDTIYQERYMGLLEDNPDGYVNGSPITFAHQLEGDVLLVYGTGDDNCHYQNCEALIDELVAHGKQFEMMAYPGRRHGIAEGRGTRKHLFTKMTNFLLERLPPGPAR
ncbi:MAG: S9 family peptidase [Phycisphaerales bacterium]